MAEINPPSAASAGEGWMGSMRGTATMADDLIAPANELWLSLISAWEALLVAERGRAHVDTTPTEWVECTVRQRPGNRGFDDTIYT